jgi:RimJ/RimL family protein N-acetyltransferase
MGFGFNRAALKHCDTPIGICGFIKRDSLDHIDLGFAFLPDFRGKGFALEAARAVIDHGHQLLNLSQIVAIVNPANIASKNFCKSLNLFLSKASRWNQPTLRRSICNSSSMG